MFWMRLDLVYLLFPPLIGSNSFTAGHDCIRKITTTDKSNSSQIMHYLLRLLRPTRICGRMTSASTSTSASSPRLLNQKEAAAVDQELFQE